MEEYRCDLCNYKTKDKSNYKRHIKSQKHKKKVNIDNNNAENCVDNAEIGVITQKSALKKRLRKNFECEYCGKIYTRNADVLRHEKTCKNKKEKEIYELKYKIEQKNEEIEKQKKIINKAEEMVIKTININDRITKYLEMNYSNVPALLPPTNEQIEEVIDIKNKDEDFCFGKYFIGNTNELVKIIGKIIIGIYKNEENIFSTDISRLSFYIRVKELIKKNKKEMNRWIKDPKGVKLKEVIINPIIKYMMEEIKSYFEKIKFKDERENIEVITRRNDELKQITDIMIKDKEELANNIVKNIAPIFKLK